MVLLNSFDRIFKFDPPTNQYNAIYPQMNKVPAQTLFRLSFFPLCLMEAIVGVGNESPLLTQPQVPKLVSRHALITSCVFCVSKGFKASCLVSPPPPPPPPRPPHLPRTKISLNVRTTDDRRPPNRIPKNGPLRNSFKL